MTGGWCSVVEELARELCGKEQKPEASANTTAWFSILKRQKRTLRVYH